MLCALQVADSCKAKGAASCETHAVDLSQPDAVESFAKVVLAKHKQVDVLVNNAGMGTAGKNTGLLEGMVSSHVQACFCQDRHHHHMACNRTVHKAANLHVKL